MEEQSTLNLEQSIQKLVLFVLALTAIGMTIFAGIYYWHHADPYVRKVIAVPGDANRGHAIFQLNCAGCHGVEANGKVGPSLRNVARRRSQWSLIQQITSGKTPPMPKFQASPSEMADLLSYIKTL